MFDINGGVENILIMLTLISSFCALVLAPSFIIDSYSKRESNEWIGAIIGALIWCLLVWVGNPSLEFWKLH